MPSSETTTMPTTRKDNGLIHIRYLITGCGRSGTQYISDRLNAVGIACKHEEQFTVFGPKPKERGDFGESSWYAAPFLNRLPANTPVLHVVRYPADVVASFGRIGLFCGNPLVHATHGKNLYTYIKDLGFSPRRLYRRCRYVFQHRAFLKTHTNCWTYRHEAERLWWYWAEWNKLIEVNANAARLPYLRVRLEDLDTCWPTVIEHLGISDTLIEPGPKSNKKLGYAHRAPSYTPPPDEVIKLAQRYGYNVN